MDHKFTFYGDENIKYEDDDIIVILATDPTKPKPTIKNCKKYGKNTILCISNNSAKCNCYKDRWINKLTVYFVWIKQLNKFILIDRKPNNEIQYNNISNIDSNGKVLDCNFDIKTTEEDLIKQLPILNNAFKNKIFTYLELQTEEINFFKNIENADSILELKTLDDRLDYIAMPNKYVKEYEWIILKTQNGHRLFKEYISSRGLKDSSVRDVSEKVLNIYSSLKKRYFKKVKSDAYCFQDTNIVLTKHEKIILEKYDNKLLFNKIKNFLKYILTHFCKCDTL
jgi:hypothetical protein